MSESQTLQALPDAGFQVHIPVFEGPLDLLLRLIEKNELDITKVALAQVTDAFLEHVEHLRATMQIEQIADFLSVAAKLILIKSRALLPKPPAAAKAVDDDEDDVGDELIRQLRAYRQYKEAAEWLRERDHHALRAYVRLSAEPRPRHVELDLSGVTLAALRDAAESVLFPSELPRPEGAIQRQRLSIVQQIQLIRERLRHWTRTTFHRLLSQRPSRLEAAVTLQAVLELMKQQVVAAHQEEIFGDITIEARVPADQITLSGQSLQEATPAD